MSTEIDGHAGEESLHMCGCPDGDTRQTLDSIQHEEEHVTTTIEHEAQIQNIQVLDEPVQIVQEEEVRSRHTSCASSATDNCEQTHEECAEHVKEVHEPIHHEESVHPIVPAELKQTEVEIKPRDENQHSQKNNEQNGAGDQAKIVRPLLQREFTQESVVKKEPLDDWARDHVGRKDHAKSLIAKFNGGMILNDNGSSNRPGNDKLSYGIGKGKGQIKQSTFH